MTVNILIGVGGTGAKLVEATLHCCVAGLGPSSLRVGFIDQDKSNGNLARADELLRTIVSARHLWRSSGSSHRIASGDLLASDIGPISDNVSVWTPHHESGQSLSTIFGHEPDDQALFDTLFHHGAAEQELTLDEGYGGRPHIGAAAITAATLGEEGPFWKSLREQFRRAKNGVPVRILLAGSVFGGTGAAGFPTIARLIRSQLEDEGITKNVQLGGVLMLPYFGFAGPDTQAGQRTNVARSEDLLVQSRSALRYYKNLFEDSRIFDQLYMVGWDRPFNLGYHQPGGGGQVNPALLPELIAGLGACRFLDTTEQGNNEVLASARASEAAISWSDLPSPDDDHPDAAFTKLGRLLRFAGAWKYWRGIISSPQAYRRFRWFERHGLGNIDFQASPPSEALRALDQYVDHFLHWAGSIEVYAKSAGMRFDLWSLDRLIDGSARPDQPTDPLKVRENLRESDYATAYSQIVVPRPASELPPSAQRLLADLNGTAIGGDHAGIGRFVAALHQFSGVTTNPEGR